MKKLVFKKWVELFIWCTLGIAYSIGACECESLKVFVIKSVICLGVMIIDYKLLSKYGRVIRK